MRARVFTWCGAALLLGAVSVQAAPTKEEVRAAVANGVAWIAAQQQVDGHWGWGEPEAATAMALLKLEHHAVDPEWGLGLPSPFDPANPYRENIIKGLDWLLARGGVMAIGMQPAGDPDGNGNGQGIYVGWQHHRNYASALALMAVCQAVEHGRTAPTGPWPLSGMTYLAIAQDLLDYLAYGQNDGGWERGGWGYYDNYVSWSDNSNGGYVTLGIAYAEAQPPVGCGLTVPQFVKDELNVWIDFVQNDVNGDGEDGGSGYNDPNSWVNVLKTGNLLQQMALVGDAPDVQRVMDALAYLERHWTDANWDPGWNMPGVANYQATFTIMKGLTALSIDKLGASEIDWHADFDTLLLAQQYPDGSWPVTYWDYEGGLLSTLWALLTLQRAAPIAVVPVAVDIKPGGCPNPFNITAKGVLPVAIGGSAAFDVSQIDPATILLEGVPPLRWNLEDVMTPYEPYLEKAGAMACNAMGGDGYLDLTLKFDIEAVAAALALPVTDREARVLRLTGKLKAEFGAKNIKGEDVVILRVK